MVTVYIIAVPLIGEDPPTSSRWWLGSCLPRNRFWTQAFFSVSFLHMKGCLVIGGVPYISLNHISWWRHQMETFAALLYWPFVRGIHRVFFFHLCLNKRLSKQSRGWWFETPTRSLWRHRNGSTLPYLCVWHCYQWYRIDVGNRNFLSNRRFKDIFVSKIQSHAVWGETE